MALRIDVVLIMFQKLGNERFTAELNLQQLHAEINQRVLHEPRRRQRFPGERAIKRRSLSSNERFRASIFARWR
jgi:hypothetical protein